MEIRQEKTWYLALLITVSMYSYSTLRVKGSFLEGRKQYKKKNT